MDFGLDEVQQDLRELAAKILGERATPERLKEVEAGEGIDRELWEQFARANLLGVALPEDVGGSGYGLMELCVLLQEVGRRVAPVPVLATVGMAALPIAQLGTPEQRKRWLPGVVEGDSILTAALQEAGVSDPLSPATLARRDGSAWRIDGRKVGVPYGPLAERVLVTARLADDADGTTAVFLVDPNAEGVTLVPTRGTHREPRANLILDGVVVDEEHMIGGDDAVATIHRYALAGLCATGIGVLEEAVRITAAYISERQQFGKPIATFQGATLRAADAYIDTQAAAVTTWSAIWRLAAGRPADDELAIAKFWIADGGQRVVHACQHLHGGLGVDVDYPIHRYFLWAKELELALGGATPQLLRLGASLSGQGG
jgi:alkylation response protein AidB-like acyl-CoA dehydrogenase